MNFKKILSIILTVLLVSSVSINAGAVKIDTKENQFFKNNKLNYNFKSTTIDTKSLSLPSSYQSTSTPVKNQGSQGCCWAFSAAAVTETYMLKNGYGEYDLSEEHMSQWATLNSLNAGWVRKPGEGAFPQTVMGYLASWRGAKNESDFPYLSTSLTIKNENYYKSDNAVNVNGIIFVDHSDRNAVKSAIMEYGAVAASYNHIGKYLNHTSEFDAYCSPELDKIIGGHSITILGWDDNFSKDNFSSNCTPKNDGAWYVKNSWGDYNGFGGYFWISYEDFYLFYEKFGVTYAITDAQPANEKTTLYQSENYGATYFFKPADHNLVASKNDTFANVFDIRQDNSVIDKVIFATESQGASYEVYLIPVDENKKPVNDRTKWKLLSSGTVPYSGYVCDDIEDYTVSSGPCAIGVKLYYNDLINTVNIGVDEWLTNTANEFLFYPNAKSGRSFYISGLYGVKDIMSVYAMSNDTLGGNLVIKAVVNEPEVYLEGDVNFDGKVNMVDVCLMQMHLADIKKFDYLPGLKADLNDDDKITMVDVTILQKYLVNLLYKLPYID